MKLTTIPADAFRRSLVLLAIVLVLGGCSNASTLKWEESVVLPDGRTVLLKRVQHFDERDFVAAHSFEFTHPTTGKVIKWKTDGFFRLAGLFFVNDTAHIMVRATFGGQNEEAGCPYPIMFLFKHIGLEWVQVPYAESPIRVVRNNTTLDPKRDRQYIKERAYRLGPGQVNVINDPVAREYYGLDLDKFPKQIFQCPARRRINFQ